MSQLEVNSYITLVSCISANLWNARNVDRMLANQSLLCKRNCLCIKIIIIIENNEC